jgi:hypothetical protein
MIEAILIAYCLIAFLIWLFGLIHMSIDDYRSGYSHHFSRGIAIVFYMGLLPFFLLWPLLLIGILLS